MILLEGRVQLHLYIVTLQPALVAEVLHSNEVDKVREAYDSVSVVRLHCFFHTQLLDCSHSTEWLL